MCQAAPDPYTLWSGTVSPYQKRRAHLGALFLFVVLELLAFHRLLSWEHRVGGLSSDAGWELVVPAAVLLICVGYGVWYFLPCKSLVGEFTNWPEGSLRTWPWRRWFLGLVAAFCLALSPGPIEALFVLGFLAAYLAAVRVFRRRRSQGTSFSGCARRMHELRFLWLATLVLAWIVRPSAAAEPLGLWLGGSGLLLAFATQDYPSLSFSYCFFHGRQESSVRFQGLLWLGRVERLVVIIVLSLAVLIWGWEAQALIGILAPYFWTRVLLNCSLKCLVKDEAWRKTLVGEELASKCRCGMVFPNEASFLVHQGAEVRDIVEIGGRTAPTGLAARRRGRPVTFEVRAAFAVLLLSLAVCAGQNTLQLLNPGLFRIQQATNYKTRVAQLGQETLVVHKALSVGEQTLLNRAISATRLNLGTKEIHGDGELEEFLGLLGIGLLALGLSHCLGIAKRFTSDILGVALVAVFTASLLGWVWVSPWISGLSLFGYLLLQRKLSIKSKLKALKASLRAWKGTWERLVLSSYRRPTACSENSTDVLSGYLRPEAFCVELGRGILSLALPKEEPLFRQFLKDGLQEYGQVVGITFPEVRFRDNLSLKPNHLSVLINGVSVTTQTAFEFGSSHLVRVTLPQHKSLRGIKTLCPITDQPAVWTKEQIAREHCAREGWEFGHVAVPYTIVAARIIIQSLADHLHEFLTIEEAKRLMNRATVHNNILVKKVLKIHSYRTIRRVLRPMLEEGFSIANHSTWLTVLAKGHGTVEELTRAVRLALEKEQPLE